MAYKMMYRAAFLFLTMIGFVVFAGGQQQQRSPVPGKVKLQGYELRFEPRENKCVLTYDGPHKGELTMGFPPPCEFLRNYKGGAQSFTYRDINATVVLAVGGPVNNSKTDNLMKAGCGTRLQAILLRRSGVSISKQVWADILICPTWTIDEKNYWLLSHPY